MLHRREDAPSLDQSMNMEAPTCPRTSLNRLADMLLFLVVRHRGAEDEYRGCHTRKNCAVGLRLSEGYHLVVSLLSEWNR